MYFSSLLLALVSSRISDDELSLLRGQLAKKRAGQEPLRAAVDVTLGYPSGGCSLGDGFDFGLMGCTSTPIKDFAPCSVYTNNTGIPCSVTIPYNSKTGHYTSKITSKTELSKQISGAISAEGAGWGLTASVSAKYMSQKQSTSDSVAFYIGHAGVYNEGYIEFDGNLALGDLQLNLLTTEPEQFISSFGRYYISRIGYGGSFIGSYQFQSSMNSDSTSLSVAESMSYDVVFSEKGSYDQKINELSTYTTETAYILTSGGDVTAYAKDDPYGMQLDFNSWWKNSQKSQGKAMTVTISSWFNIQAVQDALLTLANDTVTAMFNQSPPGSTVMTMISQEYILSGSLRNSVVNALTWDCATLSTTFKAALEKIKAAVDSHLAKIESLTEEQVFAIEQQVIAEDQTWFQATNGDFGLQTLINSNKACQSCTVFNSAYTTGPLISKTKVSYYQTCEKMCQEHDDCAVWSEYDGECYLRSKWRSPTSKTGAKSGVKTCHCFTFGGYDSSNKKTMTGTTFARSLETVYTWKLVENKNIPQGNLAGCSKYPGQDIRQDAAKLDECKAECVGKSDCVGLVADEWGTMLKKATGPQNIRSDFDTYLLTRTKNPAINSGPGCQKWCKSKGSKCIKWSYIPTSSGDGCVLFSSNSGSTTFGGYISGPPTCKYPID